MGDYQRCAALAKSFQACTLNRATDQIVRVAKGYLSVSLKDKRNHPPHAALYLTFVSLLLKSQTHLNGLTERHLQFYYEKVLRLSRLAAAPDRADL